MQQRLRIGTVMVLGVSGGLAIGTVEPSAAQVVCPQTSTPTSWNGAFLDTDTSKNGTLFDPASGGTIQLNKSGQAFATKQFSSTSDTVYAAVADFNKDGWADFVGAPSGVASGLNVFRNFTWQNENCTDATCSAHAGTACTVCAPNAAPNFADPLVVIDPKFTQTNTLGAYGGGRFSLIAADFNGDGWPDIFSAFAPTSASFPITAVDMYLNGAANDGSGNPTFGAPYSANTFTPISNTLGDQTFAGTNIKAVDYNQDGKQDVLIGTDKANGSVRILLNDCTGTMQGNGVVLCSAPPHFTDGGYLIQNLDTGTDGFGPNTGGLPVFDYADIDLDGLPDLIVGAANCCTTAAHRLRVFKGCSGGIGCTSGLENTSSQSITFTGAATAVFIADFSLDGKPDLIVATDGKNFNQAINGGSSFYYANNGTSAPFSAGVTQQLTFKGTVPPAVDDYDVGFIFDYDHDPSATPDVMIANGNDSNGYYVIADRLADAYVDCGEAFSGEIDLGVLLDDEMVVTAARLTPTFVLNGGTLTFFMSNEDPPNWIQANLCSGSATDYCAAFPKAIGRTVRWRAVMCSSTPSHTGTPVLSQMQAKFDYTAAKEHYRAGTIVNDGIVYVGAFHQPGDRGRFYALPAGLPTGTGPGCTAPSCYFEVGTILDNQATRHVYTSAVNMAVRLDFTPANAADPLLQNVLTTPDTTATSDLITWVLGKRFGVNAQFPLQKLGSVETSTPAIVTAPGRPNWYSFVTPADRTGIDAFIAANTTRKPFVMFGAKDGMIHAIHARATDIANPLNGSEAWAFIPATVAKGMLADLTATTAANAAKADGTNNPKVASYPDGSPTLADVTVGGVYKTIAAVAEGNGGKSFTVLDVTNTIDPITDAILGPTPMWSATPGESEAGNAFAKPAVARVLISNVEHYYIIAATGDDFTDALDEKGRIVSAYDVANGNLMWKFQAKCPVTSDLTVFETDDIGEPGNPALNGYSDRLVFADKCGFVYKLDPQVDLAGEFLENTGMGGPCASGPECVGGVLLANTTPDGKKQFALFSTERSTGALAAQRPIAGTIAARTDSSTRMVLFFGTGGIESVNANATNEFYALYADSGALRGKLVGDCVVGTGCEKFYGGILVTAEQVIVTKTIDPVIGTNSCDVGSSKIVGFNLDADTSGNFVGNGIDQAITSAIMGGLYGDAGAIYFATLAGDVARIGTPRAPTAGADTAAGIGQGMGIGDSGTGSGMVGTTKAFTLIGWRVVL
ncbi:MAG: PilC/PilY family type IV pilus protein [Kofleriaceae bacterium]